ncbi:hypothetical protein [Jannaschia ovalis]|uniref:Uncharacterized protein n=1 Tax=Jannaschia ovalis TaxID=3038773 RepID=A0ABY8LC58_9RHOB|nr:hypothetical protein [Jannaschia sp. GRR-S6-38]WGH77865.1 hypothetical protein P8627_12585 [Jannaschia sp. GRR-S6-38]
MRLEQVVHYGSRLALAAAILAGTHFAMVGAEAYGFDSIADVFGSYTNPDAVVVAYAIWIVNAALVILLGLRLQSFFLTAVGMSMSASSVATLVGWSSVFAAVAIVAACMPFVLKATVSSRSTGAAMPFSRFDTVVARRNIADDLIRIARLRRLAGLRRRAGIAGKLQRQARRMSSPIDCIPQQISC